MAWFGDGFHFDEIIGDGGTDDLLFDIYHYDEFPYHPEDIVVDENEVDEVVEEPGEEDLNLSLIPIIHPPYAVFHHGRHLCKQTFCSMLELSNVERGEEETVLRLRRVPILIGMKCYASQHGWLLLVHQSSTRCLLLNPVSMEVVDLPPIEDGSYFRNTDFCVLSAPPPNCVVLFVKHIFFFFCRPGEDRWTTQRLGLRWQYGASYNVFRIVDSVVSCGGKIFVSFWYGSKVKVLHPTTNPTGFRVEKINIVEELQPDFHVFTKCTKRSLLLESRGDIYLVTKIYWGGHADNMSIYSIDVWKLNLSIPCWVEVEDLGGDMVFFLGKSCCFSCPASEIGWDENLICFFEPGDGCLYVYDMRDLSVSIEQPWSNIGWQHYWMKTPLADVADVDIDADVDIADLADAAVLDEVLDEIDGRMADVDIDAAAAVEDKEGNS